MLALLARHRVMTAEQLARLVFPNLDRARHRLLILTRRGVLARFRSGRAIGTAPWAYLLGPIGATVIAARDGTEFPRPHDLQRVLIRLRYSATLAHDLAVHDHMSRLALYARHHPGTRLDQWQTPREAAEITRDKIRPDAYGIWTQPHPGPDDNPGGVGGSGGGGLVTVGFFLEHDTGTERIAVLIDKIETYGRLAARGRGRPVLFTLPTPRRETALHTAIRAKWGDRPLIQIATTAHLNPGLSRPADPGHAPGTGDRGGPDDAPTLTLADRVWTVAGPDPTRRTLAMLEPLHTPPVGPTIDYPTSP